MLIEMFSRPLPFCCALCAHIALCVTAFVHLNARVIWNEHKGMDNKWRQHPTLPNTFAILDFGCCIALYDIALYTFALYSLGAPLPIPYSLGPMGRTTRRHLN